MLWGGTTALSGLYAGICHAFLVTIILATSYVLNFAITKLNLTKFLQDVQNLIADYASGIKIAIFRSVSERQRNEWRSSSNCGKIAAKIACFNSVKPKIIGPNFIQFLYMISRIIAI